MKRITNIIISLILMVVIAASGLLLIRQLDIYKAGEEAQIKITEAVKTKNSVDCKKLKATNPDFKAWLRLEDSNIDYPVVQGKDNSKYLHTTFEGKPLINGCLFIDANTKEPFKGLNTVIYGHHMSDGSMFAKLEKYSKKNYCDSHPKFKLITEDEAYDLDVVAFCHENNQSKLYETEFDGNESEYIDYIKQNAKYLTNVDFNENDNLVTLSTCAYEFKDARYLVIGKLVPAKEKTITHYLPENSKYSAAQALVLFVICTVVISGFYRTLKRILRRKEEK